MCRKNWGYFQSQVGDWRSGRSTAQARTHDLFKHHYCKLPHLIILGGMKPCKCMVIFEGFHAVWVGNIMTPLSPLFFFGWSFSRSVDVWCLKWHPGIFRLKEVLLFPSQRLICKGAGGWREMCQKKCLMARWMWFSYRVRWLLSNHEFWAIFFDFGKWTRSLVLIL